MKRILLLIPLILFLSQCNNPKPDEKAGEKDSCCIKKNAAVDSTGSLRSEITCPQCGHKKMETMPTDICLIKYTCENCKAELHPKVGDCCVFCSYGTHKCPSKQDL